MFCGKSRKVTSKRNEQSTKRSTQKSLQRLWGGDPGSTAMGQQGRMRSINTEACRGKTTTQVCCWLTCSVSTRRTSRTNTCAPKLVVAGDRVVKVPAKPIPKAPKPDVRSVADWEKPLAASSKLTQRPRFPKRNPQSGRTVGKLRRHSHSIRGFCEDERMIGMVMILM